jgi:DNA (cytosine-5)-methyltransferase 1
MKILKTNKLIMNTNNEHKFPYNWNLKNAIFTKDKGKVFSCFACGGGSTMGYKLAGFDVIGHNDIDKKMVEVYKENHNPKYSFLESITTFAKRKDLPKELYNLDILDGSPPCSSFSMAGNREKDWGKEKVFREGQELQVLDTLFFDFIDLAKELQPKVVVAENVKGLLLGNAKQYVIKIYEAFDKAGYYVQHWLLDASKMGIPQRRERVFFIALRKDLSAPFMFQKDMFTEVPKLELEFNEKKILYKEFKSKIHLKQVKSTYEINCVNNCTETGVPQIEKKSINGKIGAVGFGFVLLDNCVPNTITTGYVINKEKMCYATNEELCSIGSYAQDYNFLKLKPNYLIGMSVPPVMTAQIASNIYDQWLSKIN